MTQEVPDPARTAHLEGVRLIEQGVEVCLPLRAVRPRAADRVEADVAQHAGCAPAVLEPRHHVNLGQPARRRLGIDPGEELGQRRGIAQMRGLHPGDLGRVLARLRGNAGVFARDRRNACGLEQPPDRQRRRGRVDLHRARKIGQRLAEGVEGGQPHLGAEMGQKRRVELGGGGEQRQAACAVEQREGLHHRVAGDVGAADVQ